MDSTLIAVIMNFCDGRYLITAILVMCMCDEIFLSVRGTLIIGFKLFCCNISCEEEMSLKLEISWIS